MSACRNAVSSRAARPWLIQSTRIPSMSSGSYLKETLAAECCILRAPEGALTEFVALIQAVEMGMEVRFNDPRFADVVTLADMVKAKR